MNNIKDYQYTVNSRYEDNEGRYYCRILNSLRTKNVGQNICGVGCPCNVEGDKCGYYMTPADETFSNPEEYKFFVDEMEAEGKIPFCPDMKGISERLQRAYAFAANAHKNQKRKGTGIPYLIHLISAVEIAHEITDDEDVLIAVLLHDTVEDTDTTVEMICREFGERVADMVAGESEDKRRDRPACDTWKERKLENIYHVQQGSREMRIIAICDKLSNLRSMYDDVQINGDKMWQKFNQKDKNEHKWYYTSFLEVFKEFENTQAYKEFVELIDKVWK